MYMTSTYLTWDKKTVPDFEPSTVEALYNDGYVFTRLGKGVMVQTRSARINLSQFSLSSENRRILKKTDFLALNTAPLPYANYSWQIAKAGTDFYKIRNAHFSAQKIKELMTSNESNFNMVFVYHDQTKSLKNELALGYCIAYNSSTIIHYSYPFYTGENKDMGLAMMLQALLWAKENNRKYVYLGSLQRPSDTYKLQLSGIEWFDGKTWTNDTEKAKQILKEVE